jgi:hypothetical protein
MAEAPMPWRFDNGLSFSTSGGATISLSGEKHVDRCMTACVGPPDRSSGTIVTSQWRAGLGYWF